MKKFPGIFSTSILQSESMPPDGEKVLNIVAINVQDITYNHPNIIIIEDYWQVSNDLAIFKKGME